MQSAPLSGEEGVLKFFITSFISQKSEVITQRDTAVSLVT